MARNHGMLLCIALLGVIPSVGMPSDWKNWRIERSQSAIDGPSITAVKFYDNARNQSALEVRFTCFVNSRDVRLSAVAHVERSGMLREDVLQADLLSSPIGRIKRHGVTVQRLDSLFAMSQTASSTMQMRSFNMLDNFVSINRQPNAEGELTINRARTIADMLPLAIEASNSIGTSEVVISSSPEVVEALNTCGANDPTYTNAEYRQLYAEQVDAEKADARERRRQQDESDRSAQQVRDRTNSQDLSERYTSEILESIHRNWSQPSSVREGQGCDVLLTVIPGGQVVDVQFPGRCDFNSSIKRTVEAAVLKAQPMPYVGYESVFQRQVRVRLTAQ